MRQVGSSIGHIKPRPEERAQLCWSSQTSLDNGTSACTITAFGGSLCPTFHLSGGGAACPKSPIQRRRSCQHQLSK